jgi:histidinol-phosphate/aromatic aminotransferase/cobyric acid decarboxylase-like protein
MKSASIFPDVTCDDVPHTDERANSPRDFSLVVSAFHAFEAETGRCGLPLSGWEIVASGITPPKGLVRRLGAIRVQPHGYTYSRDFHEARSRAAACLNHGMRIAGAPIAADQIAILQNSSTGLLLALTALREQGIRRIVIAAPVYFAAVTTCEHLDLAVTVIPAADFLTGALDVGHIAEALRQPHSALVLTNPAYSVGVEHSPTQLQTLFAHVSESVPILLDETWLGLHWNNDAPWYAMDYPPRTLILRSPSKILFLNGMKMSVLVAPADIIRIVERIGETLVGSVPGHSEAVALSYIAMWERWLGESERQRIGALRAWKRQVVAVQRANLEAWRPLIKAWGMVTAPIDSGPYALVARPQLSPGISSLATARQQGILLMTADYFYHQQPGWQGFRLNTLVGRPISREEQPS